MWSHDEQKEINYDSAIMESVRCHSCGSSVEKYTKSHYTSGIPCLLLTKYCKYCGKSLRD